MRNRFALLLALPASILLTAGLSSHQAYEAAAISNGNVHQQLGNTDAATTTTEAFTSSSIAKRIDVTSVFEAERSLQIASLIPGTVPFFTVPTHRIPVATPTKPALLITPIAPNVLKPRPAECQSCTTGSVAGKILTTKQSNPTSSKATKKKTKKKRKKATPKATDVITSVSKADEETKYVALTFDDGPSPVYTPKILAILKKAGIHATFCVIGREAKKYPEILRQIVADGHKIADHSMNHDERLTSRTDKKISEEILGTKALIESIVPGTPVEYFRAPGGNFNFHLRELVNSWGMKSLGWSVDTKDWQRPGVDQIIATVKRQLHSGGVILMHDSGGNRSATVEALEKVIPQLKKDGYQFTFPS